MPWVPMTLALTAIIALIGWWTTQNASVVIKIITTLLIIGLFIGGILAYRAEEKEKEITAYSGILEGAPITLFSSSQQAYPKLKLGDSNTFFNWTGEQGEPLFLIAEESALTIWHENGELKVSTKIRDENGYLIAEIVGNEWRLKEDNLWDRNYNQHALEVKNAKGNVVLQIVLEEDYIQFAAKMYSATGQGFAIGSTTITEEDMEKHAKGEQVWIAAAGHSGMLGVGDKTGVLEVRPPGHTLELVIEPIFMYPSEFHLGELINK